MRRQCLLCGSRTWPHAPWGHRGVGGSPGPLEEVEGGDIGGGLQQLHAGLTLVQHAQAVQPHGGRCGQSGALSGVLWARGPQGPCQHHAGTHRAHLAQTRSPWGCKKTSLSTARRHWDPLGHHWAHQTQQGPHRDQPGPTRTPPRTPAGTTQSPPGGLGTRGLR